MLITKEQGKKLLDLRDEIKHQLGFKIGYSSIWGSFVDDEDDFIIYEEGIPCIMKRESPERNMYSDWKAKTTEIHLLTQYDFHRKHNGVFVQESPNEYPLHDEECEGFLWKVEHCLKEGILIPNSKHMKKFNSCEVLVIKMHEGMWAVRVTTGRYSTRFICSKGELQRESEGFYQEVMETISEM